MMEFLAELLLAALISVLLAFVFGNLSADKPEAAEDLGPRPRALIPIQEEEMEGKSTVVALGESCSTDTKPAEVEEGRLGAGVLEKDGGVVAGFDCEKEDLYDGVVGIGRIEDYLVEQGEAKPVEQIVERGGELIGNKEEVWDVDEGNWESLLHGEDEWEEIERNDIEKLFGVASKFVAGKIGGDAVSKLSNEVQMKLYGLHKVATEGPCREPQPMVLRRLASRSRKAESAEEAMEKGKGVARRWAVEFADSSSPSGIPDPIGFTRSSSDPDDSNTSRQKKDAEAAWKAQKAWEVAQAPFKNLLMMGFMMWMAGSTVHLFSIGITFSALWQPISALQGVIKVFEPYKDPKVDTLAPKLLFIALNLAAMALGVWKLNSLGLLPSHASDWVSSLPTAPEVEYSSGELPIH